MSLLHVTSFIFTHKLTYNITHSNIVSEVHAIHFLYSVVFPCPTDKTTTDEEVCFKFSVNSFELFGKLRVVTADDIQAEQDQMQENEKKRQIQAQQDKKEDEAQQQQEEEEEDDRLIMRFVLSISSPIDLSFTFSHSLSHSLSLFLSPRKMHRELLEHKKLVEKWMELMTTKYVCCIALSLLLLL